MTLHSFIVDVCILLLIKIRPYDSANAVTDKVMCGGDKFFSTGACNMFRFDACPLHVTAQLVSSVRHANHLAPRLRYPPRRPHDRTTPKVIPIKENLSPARSARAFAIHRAACEWQLDRPILVRDGNDILSRDQVKVTPYEHQVKNLITFCRLAPVALLADDVGLGKTISAGLILAELIVRKKVRKALVVCPRILVAQWERELVDKFQLPVATATGKEIRSAIRLERAVIVTTYETVRDHLEVISGADIQMLILDEAHRLRRLHGSQNPPKLATQIRQVLAQRRFKFVLLLTATPIQNKLWDLYSLIDCLTVAKGHNHPLGTPAQFAKKYIKGPAQKALQVHPQRLNEFRAHLRRYIARTRRADTNLPFPARKVKLHLVPASADEQALAELLGRHIRRLNRLSQIHLGQALMSSPQALKAELANMLERDSSLTECHLAVEQFLSNGKPIEKMLGLGRIVDELKKSRPGDFRLVVFTLRKETQTAIGSFLQKRGISCGFIGGGRGKANQADIDRFMKATPDVNVIISTDAGAEGINLQAANVLVNYDLPWNPMVLEQRIGRIQRLGSPHEYVTIVNLAVENSVETRVVSRLAEKLQLIGNTLGEIDAILESTGVDKDNADESFTELIRKLVVDSLSGKNMDDAVNRQLASIEKAKKLLENNQKVINEQLGRLDELHTSGPSVPNLPDREPAMPLDEFVLGAFAEEGATLARGDDGIVLVTPKRGKPFKVQLGPLTDGKALPGAPVYAPGEPAFEQLVERWAKQDCTFVHDGAVPKEAELRALAEQWCNEIPNASLKSVNHLQMREVFQGEIDCIVETIAAHDKYETLVKVDSRPERHDKLPDALPRIKQVADETEIINCIDDASSLIDASIDSDEGIRAFSSFYDARRVEELKRVKQGSEAAFVKESFTPSRNASVTGVYGYRYKVVRLQLSVDVDDVGKYDTELEVIPLTAQVFPIATIEACAQSGRCVPTNWLEPCCESKRRVLRHLLERSENSGKRALPEHFSNSAITGKRLLKSEMAPSDVSGALAEPEKLVASARKGLPSEIVACELTQAKVLVDELIRSEISGRLFRRDEKSISAVSNAIGHQSEFLMCEVTNVPVLASERVQSEASRKWFRRDQIARSDKPPHRVGAVDETVDCTATGKTLLRDEVAQSDASGKWVDSELLVTSQASNLRALESELIPCALSKKRVLEKETVKCAATGVRALPDLMLKSDAFLSKLYVCPGKEVRSAISNKPMAPSEAYMCPWLGIPVLPLETAICKLTGIRVAPNALNRTGELADLRRVLDDPSLGVSFPLAVQWLVNTSFYTVNKPAWAAAIKSPTGALWAVHVRAEWLFGSTNDGMLFEKLPNGDIRKIRGYTVGTLRQTGWVWERNVVNK